MTYQSSTNGAFKIHSRATIPSFRWRPLTFYLVHYGAISPIASVDHGALRILLSGRALRRFMPIGLSGEALPNDPDQVEDEEARLIENYALKFAYGRRRAVASAGLTCRGAAALRALSRDL